MGLEGVEICDDLTKDDIVKKFQEVQKESDDFEAANKNDHQAVYGVFIAWIGHYVDLRYHKELSQKLDDRIWPYDFQIDHAGAPIACTQHSLLLAKNEKTRVALFQDDP